MNHTIHGVSRNGNQGSSGQTRLEPISGSKSLGPFSGHSPRVGAGIPSTSRSRHDQAARDHRSRPVGGQASGPGLFGVASITGSPRSHAGTASTIRRALTTPATRLVTVPAAGLALAMPKCWQPAVTPAMRQAAIAADERERFVVPSLEEWDRPTAWGHTEAAIALN